MTLHDAPAAGTPLGLRELIGILRRRRLSVALAFAVTLSICGVYLQLAAPRYEAVALMRVEPDRDLLSEADLPESASLMSTRVEGEIEILRSRRLTLALIREMSLVVDPEFGLKPSRLDRLRALVGLEMSPLPTGEIALDQVARRVERALRIRRRGASHLIEIAATAGAPDRAALLANRLAELHVRLRLQERSGRAMQAREALSGRIDGARRALEEAETRIADFLGDAVDAAISESGRADLRAFRDDLQRLERESREAMMRSDLLAGLAAGADPAALADGSGLGDEALRALLAQRTEIAGRRDPGTRQLTDAQLAARLDALDAEIRGAADAALGTTRSRLAEIEGEEARRRDDMRGALLAGEAPPETLSRLYGLRQESEIARDQYQALLSRLRQVEILSGLQVSSLEIVSEAMPSHRPSWPDTRLVLLIGIFVSLGAGGALALLREFQLGGFVNPEQVATALRSPDVISIPKVTDVSGPVSDVLVSSPLGAYAEAHRRLRFSAERLWRPASAGDGRGRILCVTSAHSGEGKTTVASSMARAFSISGRRTVLVDLDLRNPSIAEAIGLERDDSLMSYLSGDDPSSKLHLVRDGSGAGLQVIVGGARARVPTDAALLSPAMGNLLEALRASYDVIVFDLPPVLPVIDPLLMIRHADLVVMPIRFGATGQSDVREAVRRIRSELADDVQVLPVLSMEQGSGRRYAVYHGGPYSQ